MQTKQISEIAKQYAIQCHEETNHKYDKTKPYSFHLNMVADAIDIFIHLIPEEKQDIVRASGWVHDCIEDCRQTYNDVKKVCGEEVAEIAYALTNEKGKTRSERANEKYYQGIKNTPYAVFVKLADRIANVEYSKSKGSDMFEKYRKENEKFSNSLYDERYRPMFKYIDTILNDSIVEATV
jgi:(p)ppGpp synthase/HD superfamily hydrolase